MPEPGLQPEPGRPDPERNPVPRPGSGPPPARARKAQGDHSGRATLPWWALALPTLAFALLLTLLAGGDAHAVRQWHGPLQRPVVRVLERVEAVLLG